MKEKDIFHTIFNITCVVCHHVTYDYHNYCDNCGDCKINTLSRWTTEVME